MAADAPDLTFDPASAASLLLALDRDGRAVLRRCVAPARLSQVAAQARHLPDMKAGPALIDALPAPRAFQLLQGLLGEDYVLAEARLAAVAADWPTPAVQPCGPAAAGGITFWLPLCGLDVAAPAGAGPGVWRLAVGDLLVCRWSGGVAQALPAGPAIVLRFAPGPGMPASVIAEPGRSMAGFPAACRAMAAAERACDDRGAQAAGHDLFLALARLMRDYRPVDVLPLLRTLLEEADLLPAETPRWAMPELEPAPQPAAALPPPAGRGVGLCLSVRNHAGLVDRALAGLAAQERPFDAIVLVDDASDDATLERLQAFAAGRSDVQVLRNRERLGGVASIGRAIASLQTDYLAWASADDLLLPQALSRLAAAAEAYPQAALVLGETGVVALTEGRFGEPGRMAHGGAIMGNLSPYLPPGAVPAVLACRRLSFGTAWIARRDAVAAVGGFLPALGPLADFFTGLALLCRYGLAVVPERLSVMSVDAASYSRSTGSDPQAMTAIRDAFLERLKSPAFRDVYARVAATPSLVMDLQSGAEMFTSYFVRRPQHWDLMLRAVWWALRHGSLSIGRRVSAADEYPVE